MRVDGQPIFVDHDGRSARLQRVELGPKGTGAFNEFWLQRLIDAHPDTLPLGQIEPGFSRPAAICMELPTRHGPVDNLLMTGDGDIVIVETKLWRNAEARRQVVAQALDYASCIFEMGYDDFEAAVLRGDFGERQKPRSLYEALPAADVLAEPAFIDAVSLNLRNGRIVVLVVGDGIRREVERLTEVLQSHAGFHFTFALVEMAVFHLPDQRGVFVLPRTLAMTQMVERGIVRIDDQRVTVALTSPAETKAAAVTQSITAEQFFDAMKARRADVPDKLKAFLEKLAPLGVRSDFRKSLIIRWEAPNGTTVSLGNIWRDGQVWTEAVNLSAPIELAHRYNEELAVAVSADVEKTIMEPNWHIRQGGRVPRIENIVDRLEAWAGIIERFTSELRMRLAQDASS